MTADLLNNELPHGRWISRAVNAVILLVVAALVAHALLFFSQTPLEPLLRDWFADDAFYYFQTARNFSQKGVIAFDGENVTNGFHVLWFFALAPIYKLPLDPVSAIYVIKSVEVLFAGASFLCTLLVFRALGVSWFFSLFAIPYLIRYKTLYAGLETGASLLVMCASLALCVFLLRDPARFRSGRMLVFFSAFLFLAPLARLENTLFAVILICFVLLFRLRSGIRFSLADVCAAFLPFGLLMVLYFAANYLIFDTPVPVSALVKSWWSQSLHKNQSLVLTAWAHFLQMCRLRIVSYGFLWGGAALAVIAVSRLSRTYRSNATPRDSIFEGVVVSLFLFHLAKTVVYAVMGSTDAIMAEWYHVSGPLLSWMSMAIIADRTFMLVAEIGRAKHGPGFLRKCAVCLLAAGLCIAAATSKMVYDAMTMYSSRAASTEVDWRIASYRMANWLNQHAKDIDRIGVFDSGVVGYFSRVPIVNLDGLINSVEYLRMLQSGRFEEFLVNNRIGYVANAINDDEERGFAAYVAQRTGQKKQLSGKFELVYRDEQNAFQWNGLQKYRLFRYLPAKPQ